jgi:hypothetical protein
MLKKFWFFFRYLLYSIFNIFTDSQYSEDGYLEYGGTANSFRRENLVSTVLCMFTFMMMFWFQIEGDVTKNVVKYWQELNCLSTRSREFIIWKTSAINTILLKDYNYTNDYNEFQLASTTRQTYECIDRSCIYTHGCLHCCNITYLQ